MADSKRFRIERYDSDPRTPRGPSAGELLRRLLRSALGCLIAANVVVFLTVSLTYAISGTVLPTWLGLVAPADEWIYRPWGLVTYMFVQSDVLHLLFNMMWLWGFGAILRRSDGDRTLVLTYVVSGLGGGLCFLVTATAMSATMPVWLIGSSASVLGVIVGSATRNPRMRLNMLLFGEVQIRWIAAIAVLLCGVAPGWGNYPTLAAHIGGAVAGWAFIYLRYRPRKKKVYSYTRRPTQVRTHERRGLNNSEQAELDELLVRVRQSGYKNLSAKERNRLFELSNRIK